MAINLVNTWETYAPMLTREPYTLKLRQFTGWCRARSLALSSVCRADIENFVGELEARGRAAPPSPAACSRSHSSTGVPFEEELLDHSPVRTFAAPGWITSHTPPPWTVTRSAPSWLPSASTPLPSTR